jgi:hypothetical protein
MAAETLTAINAGADAKVFGHGLRGNVKFAYGVYEIAAITEIGDIFEMCRLPPGAVVIDGFVRADDIDTGAEALDIDVGWAANGTDAADPDGFGDLGLWTGDGIVGIKPETQIYFPFNGVLKDGPKTFTSPTADTIVQLEVIAISIAGHVGTVSVGVYYLAE